MRTGSGNPKTTFRLPAGISVPFAALLLVLAGGAAEAQAPPSGGDGRIYIGTYTEAIYVIAEEDGRVVDRISLETGIPRAKWLNPDRTRFYVLNIDRERVEVVDIASGRTLDVFTASRGNERIRLWGMVVAPDERHVILLGRRYRQLVDRWDVGEMQLFWYDLEAHEVVREIPWPDDRPRHFVQLKFSPDGDLLYFLIDPVRVYETEGFTEVDRWEYGQVMDEGMGPFTFGFSESPYEEEGYFTGLFRTIDPVQGRRLMGIARVDLAGRSVGFTTLGPSESLHFVLGPDGRKAYGLRREVGNYRLWTFDLEAGRVERRVPVQGRPRMEVEASSNGEFIYVWQAGNTIDLVDPETGRYVHTIELDADTTTEIVVLPDPPGRFR